MNVLNQMKFSVKLGLMSAAGILGLGIFAALFYLFIRNGANRNPDLYRSLIDLKSAMLGR